MKKFVFLFLHSFLCIIAFAQETEKAIAFRHAQFALSQDEKRWPTKEARGGGSLTLPFFDDFAQYTLPTNNPAIPSEWQRWSDTSAFINSTLAISPLTVGVATLDGLKGNGYPYNFTDEFAQGHADTLTSLPINLSGFSASDSVYLIFHYQGGGLGNAPEDIDSLIIDFYSPFGPGQWYTQQSIPGSEMETFERVMIAITQEEFFLDGFRFRFRNKATLSGSWDNWHIDYVLVQQDIVAAQFNYSNQVAMQLPINTLLKDYTAMPWTHFVTDPSGFMLPSFEAFERNLGPTANITTGYSIAFESTLENFPNQDNNPFGNANQELVRTINLNGYTYDTDVNDTCATFNVCTYIVPVDEVLSNDTVCFKQVFNNYYAYDDGSAERSYAVDALGARVAVKYRNELADTLLGIFVHFIPNGIDYSLNPFLLRAWTDGGTSPGNEIGENFTFNYPRYYDDGNNLFSYYPYDTPQRIEPGNFYVGFAQTEATDIRVGNDKNTNNNPTKLFYSLGATNPWIQSEATGSIMIRPVFKSGKSEVWNSITENNTEDQLGVFPNPFTDRITIRWTKTHTPLHLQLFDNAGRVVRETHFQANGDFQWDLNGLPASNYFMHITDLKTGDVFRQKLLRF
jgi:hypothetical protein